MPNSGTQAKRKNQEKTKKNRKKKKRKKLRPRDRLEVENVIRALLRRELRRENGSNAAEGCRSSRSASTRNNSTRPISRGRHLPRPEPRKTRGGLLGGESILSGKGAPQQERRTAPQKPATAVRTRAFVAIIEDLPPAENCRKKVTLPYGSDQLESPSVEKENWGGVWGGWWFWGGGGGGERRRRQKWQTPGQGSPDSFNRLRFKVCVTNASGERPKAQCHSEKRR